MAILRVRKGAGAGTIHAVHDCKSPTLLGRDPSVHIVVEDDRASRKHARIFRIHGAWILQDLRSRNGTALDGKPVESARLRSKSVIRIGGTLLSFHPDEFPPPPEEEVYGTRLLATLREEGGVFVYRALQSAMDREVRIDRVGTRWRLPARAREALEAALGDARELEHPGIQDLVHARAGENGSDYVVLRLRAGKPLTECLGRLIKKPLMERIRFLRSLADVLLHRSVRETLRWPLSLEQVTVVERRDENLASIAAVELPTIATTYTGSLLHQPAYAPYIAPELTQNGSPATAMSVQSVTYCLGALGYHLICGQPPMGKAPHRKLLAHHRNLVPAPASLLAPDTPEELSALLQAMLAKDPAERPSAKTEILSVLDRAAEKVEELQPLAEEEVLPEPGTPAEMTPGAPAPRTERPAETATSHAPKRSKRTEPGGHRPSPGRRRGEAAAPGPHRDFLGSLVALPLWAGLWILLFIGARFLARFFFVSYR